METERRGTSGTAKATAKLNDRESDMELICI